jgi:hypothetical protein
MSAKFGLSPKEKTQNGEAREQRVKENIWT